MSKRTADPFAAILAQHKAMLRATEQPAPTAAVATPDERHAPMADIGPSAREHFTSQAECLETDAPPQCTACGVELSDWYVTCVHSGLLAVAGPFCDPCAATAGRQHTTMESAA